MSTVRLTVNVAPGSMHLLGRHTREAYDKTTSARKFICRCFHGGATPEQVEEYFSAWAARRASRYRKGNDRIDDALGALVVATGSAT